MCNIDQFIDDHRVPRRKIGEHKKNLGAIGRCNAGGRLTLLTSGFFMLSYVDDQPYNQATFYQIISRMAHFSSTTKTSVIYRLNALKLLTNNTRYKLIGQLIRGIYPKLIAEYYH